ncbi:hypothetical protein KIPB_008626, partial [Kipferlia bialata]|eukprot:g8626.t1
MYVYYSEAQAPSVRGGPSPCVVLEGNRGTRLSVTSDGSVCTLPPSEGGIAQRHGAVTAEGILGVVSVSGSAYVLVLVESTGAGTMLGHEIRTVKRTCIYPVDPESGATVDPEVERERAYVIKALEKQLSEQ